MFYSTKSRQDRSLAGCTSCGSTRGVDPGVPGVPWHPQILADRLTLSQPRGADYAHQIFTGTPRFSDLPTALSTGTENV
jgi:hypothetical protein